MVAVAEYDLHDAQQRQSGIAAAVRMARRGRLVVFPVDYGYGIGTDAFSAEGVAALLRAKNRGRGAPVPVLVRRVGTLDGLTVHSRVATELAQAFWPGPLILLASPAPSLAWDLGGVGASAPIAVRMPVHPVALAILKEVGPMAVLAVDEQALPQGISVVLRGGNLLAGQSTVVDVTADVPQVVREGLISLREMQQVNPSVALGAPLD